MMTFEQKGIRCGKLGCTRCPHGPYWYAFFKEQGKTKCLYIGRVLPGEEKQAEPSCVGFRHWLKILTREKLQVELACEILEVDYDTSRNLVFAQVQHLLLRYARSHPCDVLLSECLERAWQELKRAHGWD